MSKKEALIIQFDTDSFYHETLELVLYNMGIDPTKKVRVLDKEGVRSTVKDIEAKKIKPDVVIVDTYMGINNEDGSKIAAKIREFSPDIKIVGYAIMETNEWSDYEIIKSNRDAEKTVVKVMEEVLGLEFNSSDQEDPENQWEGNRLD